MAWWSCGLIIQSDKVLSTLMSNLVFKQSVWSNAMSIPLARMWGLATVWHVWIAGPQHRHWVPTDALCANAWYLPTCLAIVMANWINNAAKSLKRACFQLCRFSLPIYSLQPGRTNSSLPWNTGGWQEGTMYKKSTKSKQVMKFQVMTNHLYEIVMSWVIIFLQHPFCHMLTQTINHVPVQTTQSTMAINSNKLPLPKVC